MQYLHIIDSFFYVQSFINILPLLLFQNAISLTAFAKKDLGELK